MKNIFSLYSFFLGFSFIEFFVLSTVFLCVSIVLLGFLAFCFWRYK